MTRRERLEARAAKREQWAQGRTTKAAAAWNAGDLREERSGIPLGQPVISGHHSERRHRRAIDKAHAAMDRAVGHEKMASHHAQAASSIRTALDRSIFSDDPDAVEALEAKLAGLEAQRAEIKAVNALLRKNKDDEAAKVRARAVSRFVEPNGTVPAYKARNLGGEITRCRKRIAEVKARAAKVAKAEAAGGCVVTCGGGSGDWCSVTFAEKPEREILAALRAADFRWSAPSWYGSKARLPAAVAELAHAAAQEGSG